MKNAQVSSLKKAIGMVAIMGALAFSIPVLADDAPASGDANATQGTDHTGNYQVQLTGQTTQKTIHYNCNKLNIFVNNGATLDGDVDCNEVTLATNGLAHATLTGSSTSVNVQDLNNQSQLDLTGMTIDSLNIAMVNSGAIGRFKISKSAHVRILQGFGALYFRAEDGADPMPVVRVDQINGPAEIHWCGVSVQVTQENDPPEHPGKVLEDCGW
jgi:hypothetical protein